MQKEELKELEKIPGLDEPICLDTSEDGPVYMLCGRNRTRIRLSPAAYELLHGRNKGMSFEELAEKIGRQMKKRVTPDDVREIYQRLVDQMSEIERNPQRKRSGFLFRLPFFPKTAVNRMGAYLSVFFSPPVVWFFSICFVALAVYALSQGVTIDRRLQGLGWGAVLFTFSMLLHELGHASACVRYGVKPNEIGFTIYVTWPAFYCDVSSAWKLKRWQRVVVDLGGIYFQLIVSAFYAVGYVFTNWEPFKMAVLMIIATFVFSLNPIFKFDGYWVVADVLGITNLDQQRWRILGHAFKRMARRPVKPLPWPTNTMAILTLFTVASLGVWGYFMWKVVPVLWTRVAGYPAMIFAFTSDLFKPPHMPEKEQLKAFLASTVIVIIVALMLWRLIRGLAHSLMKWPRAQKLFSSR